MITQCEVKTTMNDMLHFDRSREASARREREVEALVQQRALAKAAASARATRSKVAGSLQPHRRRVLRAPWNGLAAVGSPITGLIDAVLRRRGRSTSPTRT